MLVIFCSSALSRFASIPRPESISRCDDLVANKYSRLTSSPAIGYSAPVWQGSDRFADSDPHEIRVRVRIVCSHRWLRVPPIHLLPVDRFSKFPDGVSPGSISIVGSTIKLFMRVIYLPVSPRVDLLLSTLVCLISTIPTATY